MRTNLRAKSSWRGQLAGQLRGRVESWRAHGRVRWLFHCFRFGPQSGSHGHVSSSRHVKRSMRFSHTTLSCTLRAKFYDAYEAGGLSTVTRVPRRTPPLPTTVQEPKKLRNGSAFRLTYIPRRRSCRFAGAFIISPLPPLLSRKSCTAGSLCSTGVTPLHSYYGPIRHRLVFGRFPGVAGYTVDLVPLISQRDEDGFSSCLGPPCHRAIATTPPE